MKKSGQDRRWMPRVPVPPPTRWHEDKSKYNRKKKHKKGNK